MFDKYYFSNVEPRFPLFYQLVNINGTNRVKKNTLGLNVKQYQKKEITVKYTTLCSIMQKSPVISIKKKFIFFEQIIIHTQILSKKTQCQSRPIFTYYESCNRNFLSKS